MAIGAVSVEAELFGVVGQRIASETGRSGFQHLKTFDARGAAGCGVQDPARRGQQPVLNGSDDGHERHLTSSSTYSPTDSCWLATAFGRYRPMLPNSWICTRPCSATACRSSSRLRWASSL